MDKQEFLSKLRAKLFGLPQKELEERLSFYSEMIDDRIEEGLSEEDAVKELGTVYEGEWQVSAEDPQEFIYEISEEFHNINIDVLSADINLAKAKDNSCKVICHNSRDNIILEVQNDTLQIRLPEKAQNNGQDIPAKNRMITLYLPEREYGALNINAPGGIQVSGSFHFDNIKLVSSLLILCINITATDVEISTSSGDIWIVGLTAEKIKFSSLSGDISARVLKTDGDAEIETDSGDINIQNSKCNGLIAETSSGDILLRDVIAVNNFSLQSGSGDVKFDRCDAAEINVKTDSGDVQGNLLSEKEFICKASSGKINVPGTVTGGKYSIETGSGDINIEIAER